MHPVFQEIQEWATARLREALQQELGEEPSGKWDPDAFEQEVRQFIRQLGQQLLQSWAEVKVQQAQEQARLCCCGHRRQIHKLKPFWWLSTFGPVAIEVPQLRCPQGHGQDRPFQRLTGLECRGKSLAIQRVLTDFGAEKSFAQASAQLWEHYGVSLDPSSVRQVVVQQAQRAEGFVQGQHQEAVVTYQGQKSWRPGVPWLVVESDGSMVRTGELELDPGGGLSPKRHRPKKRRQTQWREVRLSTVQVPEEEKRWYGAVLGFPPKGGGADVCPGLAGGLWGEHLGAWGRGWGKLGGAADSGGVSQAALSAGPVSFVRAPLCWGQWSGSGHWAIRQGVGAAASGPNRRGQCGQGNC